MLLPVISQSLPKGIAFDLLLVEGGSFFMGSGDADAFDWEKPVHPVKLSSFYIGKFPVTQAVWKAVMNGDSEGASNPSYFKGDARPVETVSWDDAQLFIEKLKAQTGKPYRLPTEAEWEYAARGGNAFPETGSVTSEGFKYSGSNKLKEVGWYDDNSHDETKPVGLKFPNELGIFDLSGNVWEWCEDFYSDGYYAECLRKGLVENPPGPEKGTFRVIRGGSYFGIALYCRPSYRATNSPGLRGDNLGFRLALSLQ